MAAVGLTLLVAAAVPLRADQEVTSSDAVRTDGRVETTASSTNNPLEFVLFYLTGGAAVFCAVAICATRNIVRMAVWLFGALGSVAMMYFLLAANFLGAIQLIVYAGGTLILLVFGVMLTSKSPWVRFEPRRWEVALSALVCLSLLVCLCLIVLGVEWPVSGDPGTASSVERIGRTLMGTYLVPFELAGVLLMVVMVGAAHLARQEE